MQVAVRGETESFARAQTRTKVLPQAPRRLPRNPQPRKRGGNSGAHSIDADITPGAGTALQEGERIQEPGHATRANRVRIKGVSMKRQAHAMVHEIKGGR
jgi:hypothetical protein